MAYADQKIMEYNFDQKEYTPWCRQLLQKWHPQWLKRHSKMTQLLYNSHKPHQILVRDEQMFAIIDKQQPLPLADEKLFQRSMWQKKESAVEGTRHGFHICNKFKYMLHMDVLNDDFMLVVERPPLAIMDTLPPPLKQKKFGT